LAAGGMFMKSKGFHSLRSSITRAALPLVASPWALDEPRRPGDLQRGLCFVVWRFSPSPGFQRARPLAAIPENALYAFGRWEANSLKTPQYPFLYLCSQG